MKEKNHKFIEWSNRWNAARENCGAIDEVIALCKETPTDWKRTDWKGETGYRHNHKSGAGSGEQEIERQLLAGAGLTLHEVLHGSCRYSLRVIYQKMPLANQRSGQRVADVFGLLTHRRSVHPVMIEVKKN